MDQFGASPGTNAVRTFTTIPNGGGVGTIDGVVLRSVNQQPIPGATISILPSTGLHNDGNVTAAPTGEYSLGDIPAAPGYFVSVTAVGFTPSAIQQTDVSEDGLVTLNFELVPLAGGDTDGDGFSDDVEIAASPPTDPEDNEDTPILDEVWVNFGWSDPPYTVKAATEANPLDTLEEAIDIVATGGTIKFKVTSPDWGDFTGTISTSLTLAVPPGGDPVRIGASGGKSVSKGGASSVESDGFSDGEFERILWMLRNNGSAGSEGGRR